MEKQELLFTGFRAFDSKAGKRCYLLSFISRPINYKGGCYCKSVDLFVTEAEYNAFIKENDVMQWVELSYEVIGDKVRYKI